MGIGCCGVVVEDWDGLKNVLEKGQPGTSTFPP